ncbi:FAD-dependent monooxygenase [Nonomuraea sp. NPDC049625]|uniref:FAD-dependent oxidoreductase n=1 Tax=Nonomuraea sp. NPDC049625 TaxID=3155775 RepID=UPI0034178704
MQVVVIGAGLGGLCLAQGLKAAGVAVTVHERDPSVGHRPQGYRIHLDSRAARALSECLPPRLYELFTAMSGQPSRRVTIVDEHLRELHAVRFGDGASGEAPETFNAAVDRMTLRTILLAGLDEVRFGAEFVRYEQQDGGRVRAFFADGSTAAGDLLVGADGIGSRVRGQRLPQARVKDLGVRCLYGRTTLDDRVAGLLPPALAEGFMSVRSARAGLALGLVRPRENPAEAAARLWPGLRLDWAGDYVMWALAVPAAALPGTDRELAAADGAHLHELAAGHVAGWHPDLVELVASARADQTFYVPVRSSVPLKPWGPDNVTLLGDAVHAMSPAQGSGANCALLDAALLCRAVGAGGPLVEAVGGYERKMTELGFAAVRASERAAAGGGLLAKVLARLASRRPNQE